MQKKRIIFYTSADVFGVWEFLIRIFPFIIREKYRLERVAVFFRGHIFRRILTTSKTAKMHRRNDAR